MALEQDYLNKHLGVVVNAEDPLQLGRVQAIVPGFFEKNDPNILPWIYRESSSGGNQFSSMNIGDKILVSVDPYNPSQFNYASHPQPSPEAKKILKDAKDTHIVYVKKTDNGIRGMWQSNSDGTMILNGNSKINLEPSGEIVQVSQGGKSVQIKNDSVVLGDDSKAGLPAVLGDVLKSLINAIAGQFTSIAEAFASAAADPTSSSPYETLQAIFNNIVEEIGKYSGNLYSSTVKITP